MYMPGNYKWGKRNTGRQKIGTGGKEKASLQYNCPVQRQGKIYDLSSTSIKIHMDWKENSAHIISHVVCDKNTRTDDNDIFIPTILD